MPKGLTMQDVTFGLEVTPYSDTSTGTARPLVLVGWRKGIFSLKHNLTHTGPRQNIMSGRKCPNNLHSGYKSAMSEKNSKAQRHIEPGVHDFEVPQKTFHSGTHNQPTRCQTASNMYSQP